MKKEDLENIINEAFEKKQSISEKSDKKVLDAINETIELADKGSVRVAEKKNGQWSVNQWVKKAILLSFRVNKMTMSKGPYTTWYDKVQGKSVLLLGAGGACRGIIDPLLAANPRSITIANRTLSNAHALCGLFKHNPKYDRLFALSLDDLADRSPRPIDLVVNTTSLGLSSGEIGFSTKMVESSFCYDMSYGENAVFARWALAHGAQQSVDGLGMLVEQAAESFCLWRGVLPATDKIYEALEKQVRGQL